MVTIGNTEYSKDNGELVITEGKAVITRCRKEHLIMEKETYQSQITDANKRIVEIDKLIAECNKLGL